MIIEEIRELAKCLDKEWDKIGDPRYGPEEIGPSVDKITSGFPKLLKLLDKLEDEIETTKGLNTTYENFYKTKEAMFK
jgi:hypothetical protein